jgi:hypothetical protein
MKNPSPETSSPVGDAAASGTTRTAVGTPFSRYNDPPNGTPATGTFTFTAFGIGSRFPPLADGEGVDERSRRRLDHRRTTTPTTTPTTAAATRGRALTTRVPLSNT